MRREILWGSARGLLDGEEILDVAYMWRRHRWAIPAGLVVGGAVALLAMIFGFSTATGIGVGAAALAVLVSAATEYSVLAMTSRGLALMGGGRIRQVARPPVEWLPADTPVEKLVNNLVVSDWRVGDQRFSVLRRYESTMSAISLSQRS